ncbi:hypothetical protein ACLOJK_036215 [Asimina triloba]
MFYSWLKVFHHHLVDAEEKRKLFQVFLLHFLRVFKKWEPTYSVQFEAASSSSGSEEVLVGCSVGHPAEIILAVIQEIQRMSVLVADGKLLWGVAKAHSTNERKESGRGRKFCTLKWLLNKFQETTLNLVSSAAVVHLKLVTGAFAADEHTSLPCIEKTKLLQKILLGVVSIISTFIDWNANVEEKSQLCSSSADSACTVDPSSSLKVSFSDAKSRWQQRAIVSVLEAGGLNWLVGKIQILSLEVLREAVYPSKGILLELERRRVDLSTETVFCVEIEESIGEKLRQCYNLQNWNDYAVKLSRLLCSFLLAPEDMEFHCVQASVGRSAVPISLVYWELSVKWIMRVVHTLFPCIKACSNQNELPSHLSFQQFICSGQQHLIIVLILIQLSLQRIFALIARNLQETTISTCIFFLVIDTHFNSDDALSSPNSTINGGNLHLFIGNPIPSLTYHWPIINSLISAELLMPTFGSILCKLAPTGSGGTFSVSYRWRLKGMVLAYSLQHYVLYAFRKVLVSSPRLLEVFRGKGIWDLIFSENFFYFGSPLEEISEENITYPDFIPENFNVLSNSTKGQVKHSEIEILQVEVISFVEFAATLNGNSHNLIHLSRLWPECSALLDALEQSACNPEIATVLAKSLQRILQLATEQTLASFKTLDASARVLKVACIQAQELGRLLPPCSGEDQAAKLQLCSKYLETFTRAKERENSFAELSIDLLIGMRDLLLIDQMYYQTLFHDGECFLHIVSLLNGTLDEKTGEQLVLNVLQTLTSLLSGNDTSKSAFRSLVGVGYQTLQSLLLDFCQWRPGLGLLDSLLDMLVDGKFDTKNVPIIKVLPVTVNSTLLTWLFFLLQQNEDVIILFLSVLQKSSDSLRHYGLDVLQHLLKDSITNRASCVRAGMLGFLLGWFSLEENHDVISKIAQLIQVVGGHSISGTDIRKIFALLRSEKIGSSQKHCSLLLTSVQSMLKEKGPTAFFELNGNDSGQKKEIIWIGMRKAGDRRCYKTLEELFLGEAFCVAIWMAIWYPLKNAGSVYFYIPSYLFHTQAPTHDDNSQFQFRCIHRYVKINDVLTRCSIGAKVVLPPNEEDNSLPQMKESFPFLGQIGPVYMFGDAVSSEQIRGIYCLGPSYMYSFLDNDIALASYSPLPSGMLDAKDGLASKIIFGLNAQLFILSAIFCSSYVSLKFIVSGMSELLVKDAISRIYLNPHIWLYADYAVQRELYMFLIQYFEDDPRLLASQCQLPRVIDVIRQFYWDKLTCKYAFGRKPLLHPVTGQVIGKRPGQEELHKLRVLLLSLAETVAPSDIKALVAFFERSQDMACIEDVLNMVIRAISQKQLLMSFLEQVIIGDDDYAARKLAYVFIMFMLKHGGEHNPPACHVGLPSEKKGGRFFNLAVGRAKSLSESQRKAHARFQSILSAISDRLFMFPQTDLLCATLFDVLLGGASPKQILGLIFKIVSSCEDNSRRWKILTDLLDLVDSNPSNTEALMFPEGSFSSSNPLDHPELESFKDISSAATEAVQEDDGQLHRHPQGKRPLSDEDTMDNGWWSLYDKMWILISEINDRGPSKMSLKVSTTAGPSFGQRARGLVESLNIPAAEMAAVVVSGGIGNALGGKPNKYVDKAMLLRGEKCPRLVFRLVILYLCESSLERASRCVQQFISLLPCLLTADDEQNKSRLQLFIWCLLIVRSQYGTLDDGARFHVISHLIRETVNCGKSMLATTISGRDDSSDSGSNIKEAGSIDNLIQKERILSAVIDEAKYMKGSKADRLRQLQELRVRMDEASSAEFIQKKAFEDELQTNLSSILASEDLRRTISQFDYEADQQTVAAVGLLSVTEDSWLEAKNGKKKKQRPVVPNSGQQLWFLISWQKDEMERRISPN